MKTIKKYIDEHLKKRFIKSSFSSALSPVFLIKKFDEKLRFCVNYKKLNAITVKNRYSISFLHEIFEKLSNAKIFSKLNVIYAFNRIRIKKSHEGFTTFNIWYGKFEYLMMLFELCNAFGTFQNYINNFVKKYLDTFCTTYLNDILIYSNNEAEHTKKIMKVLKRLKKAGLQADIDKCEFSVKKIKYLGFIISTEKIKINSEKIKAILNGEKPICVKKVQNFLNFANFYKRFIGRFSIKIRALTKLTRGEQFIIKRGNKKMKYEEFVGTKKCQKAFDNLKAAFVSTSIFAHYNSDVKTGIKTNASNFVMAEILF